MHELLRIKLARRFELFDTNGDGYVDEADFAEQAARLVAAAGIDADTPEAHRLREEYHEGWGRMHTQVGKDRDTRLTETEFVDAWNAIVEANGFDKVILPIVDTVMDLMDTDRDGALGQSEFVRWLCAYEITKPDAAEAFHRLDRDETGNIDRAELTDAFIEYFTGTDPNAPGTWLYGPPHPAPAAPNPQPRV